MRVAVFEIHLFTFYCKPVEETVLPRWPKLYVRLSLLEPAHAKRSAKNFHSDSYTVCNGFIDFLQNIAVGRNSGILVSYLETFLISSHHLVVFIHIKIKSKSNQKLIISN